MFPKAVKQSKAGLGIEVHFYNKGQMFPVPAALGKLVSSVKEACFDGYAWLSGCGTAQLIIVAGSMTLDDVPPPNLNRYANGGNVGWTRRLSEESHSRVQCCSFATCAKCTKTRREFSIRSKRLPPKRAAAV